MRLYHYTKVSSFQKIWDSKTLKFSDAKNANDIFERGKLISIPNIPLGFFDESGHSKFISNFYEILYSYRQISMSMDYSVNEKGYTSPMMWGHYGNSTKGVCIELDSEKLNLNSVQLWSGRVRYVRKLPFLNFKGAVFNNDEDIFSYIEKHKNNIFYKKHIHWKYENEYRLISRTIDYLSIENAITAIYIVNNEGRTNRLVKRLVQDTVPICKVVKSPLWGYAHLTSYNTCFTNR